jgi:hypothetical protein
LESEKKKKTRFAKVKIREEIGKVKKDKIQFAIVKSQAENTGNWNSQEDNN